MTGRDLESDLIEEGIRQILEKGMEGFSARAVAEACHVSCSAPFKHFKGRREFLLAVSNRLDEELLKRMEEIKEQCADAYRQAHMMMNEAFIEHLCRYPFLISPSFWRTIDEAQIGLRRWKSFGVMVDSFEQYCKKHKLPDDVRKAYYFNFQTLAYGSAFVINSGLLLEGEEPVKRIRELQDRIYENLKKTMGLAN